jgi:hypothetical protein
MFNGVVTLMRNSVLIVSGINIQRSLQFILCITFFLFDLSW